MTDGRDAALIQWFPDLPRGIAELGGKAAPLQEIMRRGTPPEGRVLILHGFC